MMKSLSVDIMADALLLCTVMHVLLFAIHIIACTILTLQISHTIHSAVAIAMGSFLFRRNHQLQHVSTTVVYHSFKRLPYFIINIASGKYCVLISIIHTKNALDKSHMYRVARQSDYRQ